jgi:FixJ family two-component response regulator
LIQLKKYNPALIICDVQLPGRSGIELLQQLRAMGFVTPVVFMTGNDDTNTILAAMRLGAVDYLIKPISMKDVRRVLERIKFAEDKKAKVQELRAEHAAESEIAKQEKMLGLLQATSVEKNKKNRHR